MLSTYSVTAFISFCTYFHLSHCFPPSFIQGETRSKSLSFITKKGTITAVGRFIKMYGIITNGNQSVEEMLQTYITSDQDSYQKLLQDIQDIITYVTAVRVNRAAEAMYHVNGEQIFLAHNYIKERRQRIKDEASRSDPDIQYLRELIGQCLYTIQEFYSNTNWVELYGATSYEDFGIDGVKLKNIATTNQKTCSECDFFGYGDPPCDNNLLIPDTLTSGYRSGQDIIKPILSNTDGKCSHGGLNDATGRDPATGGINKERDNELFSPHYKLHADAVEAAILATEEFLINEDTGIHKVLGQDLFQKVLYIKQRRKITKSSLAFVIDVSGSMSDDIKATTEQTINLVSSSQGSKDEPENYVLATFNDPESLTTGKVTTDGMTMISWLKSLKANGGKDCPEFAMSGIAKAIQLSLNGSTIYVFTDADAKDADKETQVLEAANKKNISLVFFITGSCGRRKRSGRLLKRSAEIFKRIAQKTGGSVIQTSKAELSEVINTVVIKKNIPSSSVIIDQRNQFSGTELTFPVDNMIHLLKVEVEGTTSVNDFILRNEEGAEIKYGGGYSELSKFYYKKKSIITVQRPDPGQISLVRKSSGNWNVKVGAQSRLDVDIEIHEVKEDGFLYKLSGNPITGKEYYIVADIHGLQENASVSTIVVVYASGDMVELDNITANLEEERYRVAFTFEGEVAAFQVIGYDSNSNTFQRMLLKSIRPVDAKLSLDLVEDLTVAVNQTISYSVENSGKDRKTFIVRVSDNKNMILPHLVFEHTIDPESVITNSFQVLPSIGPTILTFNVELKLQKTFETLQTIQKKCLVSRIQKTTCVVINVTNLCPPESQTVEMCSEYEWTGMSKIRYNGTSIDVIYLTNAPNSTTLSYSHVEGATGLIHANVSGTCCSTSIYLNVVDKRGYFSRCHFDVAENKTTTAPIFFYKAEDLIVVSTPTIKQEEVKEETFPYFAIIIAVSAVVLLLIIAVATVIIKKKQSGSSDCTLPEQQKLQNMNVKT